MVVVAQGVETAWVKTTVHMMGTGLGIATKNLAGTAKEMETVGIGTSAFFIRKETR